MNWYKIKFEVYICEGKTYSDQCKLKAKDRFHAIKQLLNEWKDLDERIGDIESVELTPSPMGITKMIDKILSRLDKEATTRGDTALFLILNEYKGVLPEVSERFHKSFRQIDVLPNSSLDMAVWHLLSNSPLFWKIFHEETNNSVH